MKTFEQLKNHMLRCGFRISIASYETPDEVSVFSVETCGTDTFNQPLAEIHMRKTGAYAGNVVMLGALSNSTMAIN
jgi:hypothetical protein